MSDPSARPSAMRESESEKGTVRASKNATRAQARNGRGYAITSGSARGVGRKGERATTSTFCFSSDPQMFRRLAHWIPISRRQASAPQHNTRQHHNAAQRRARRLPPVALCRCTSGGRRSSSSTHRRPRRPRSYASTLRGRRADRRFIAIGKTSHTRKVWPRRESVRDRARM